MQSTNTARPSFSLLLRKNQSFEDSSQLADALSLNTA